MPWATLYPDYKVDTFHFFVSYPLILCGYFDFHHWRCLGNLLSVNYWLYLGRKPMLAQTNTFPSDTIWKGKSESCSGWVSFILLFTHVASREACPIPMCSPIHDRQRSKYSLSAWGTIWHFADSKSGYNSRNPLNGRLEVISDLWDCIHFKYSSTS